MARRKKTASKQETFGHVTSLMDFGEWWALPKFLLVLMSDRAAVMLAFLINHRKKCWNNHPTNPPWWCTIEKMKSELQLTRGQQDRILKELKGLKLVRVTIKGQPAKRYFKIDDVLLDKMHMQVKQKRQVEAVKKAEKALRDETEKTLQELNENDPSEYQWE